MVACHIAEVLVALMVSLQAPLSGLRESQSLEITQVAPFHGITKKLT